MLRNKSVYGSLNRNLLVDNVKSLEKIFNQAPILIATHCEDNQTITQNFSEARKRYGKDIPVTEHPIIRSEEACYLSSSFAVELAKKNNTYTCSPFNHRKRARVIFRSPNHFQKNYRGSLRASFMVF